MASWGLIKCLLDAVTKLKMDIKNGVTTANLTGCHLFLQVFYIDNLDLGIFNMKHDVFLRIKQFDQDMLRRMATMATDVGVAEPSFASSPLRNPSTVCYSRKTCADEACSDSKSTTRSWQTPPCTNSRSVLSKGAAGKPPQHAAQPEFAPTSPRQLSALDYSNCQPLSNDCVSASCSPTEGAECAGYPPCDHSPTKHPD